MKKLSLFCALVAALSLSSMPSGSAQEIDTGVLDKWLSFQNGVRTLEGSFSQTRTLRTVRAPQKSTGKIYASVPDKFRWESKDVVAVRSGDTITLMNVKMKMAKKESASSAGGPAAALNFASGNFPKNAADFQKDFDIRSMEKSGSFYVIETRPKDRKVSRAMNEITFYVHSSRYYLGGLNMEFRDGSNVSTQFSSLKFNSSIPSSKFVADLEGYKVAGG